MKYRRHVLLLAAVLIVSLDSARLSAQPSGQFQEFSLVLETPKSRYLELQPIPLVITLRNDTQSPLTGHTVLEFGASFLRLYIDRSDGPQEIRVSMLVLDVYAEPHVFQPGEQIKKTAGFNYRLDKVFPKPGTYRLHVCLTSLDGKESVSSKPMEVEIVQPDGPDAQALQFIRDHSEPGDFFTGIHTVKNPEQLQVLENFVAVYGESTYADDASLTLGEVQFANRDYQKARTILEKLSKKTNYAFAATVSEYLKLIEQRTRAAAQ